MMMTDIYKIIRRTYSGIRMCVSSIIWMFIPLLPITSHMDQPLTYLCLSPLLCKRKIIAAISGFLLRNREANILRTPEQCVNCVKWKLLSTFIVVIPTPSRTLSVQIRIAWCRPVCGWDLYPQEESYRGEVDEKVRDVQADKTAFWGDAWGSGELCVEKGRGRILSLL